MYCGRCGVEISGSADYCPECGAPLQGGAAAVSSAGAVSDRSTVLPLVAAACAVLAIAAVVLALFAGGFVGTVPAGSSDGSEGDAAAGMGHDAEPTTAEPAEADGRVLELSMEAPSFDLEPSASSTLPAEPDHPEHYSVKNVLDKDINTAWNEGDPGDGEGSWIRLRASSAQTVHGIRIVPGYAHGAGIFSCNNRPKDVRVSLSDGYELSYTLEDLDWGSWQEIRFDKAHETSSITVTIESVYLGTQFETIGPTGDCCVSELEAF